MSKLIVGAVAAVGKAVMSGIAGDDASTVIESAVSYARNQDRDLVQYTRSARVEPICIVDASCLAIPFINSVSEAALNNFIGYYLTAISLDNTVKDIAIRQRLQKFTPNPQVLKLGADLLSRKDITHTTPLNIVTMVDALEMQSNGLPGMPGVELRPATEGKADGDHVSGGVATQSQILERISSLGTGKIIDVTLSADDRTVTVPIGFRLHTIGMSPENVITTLDFTTYDGSARSRWRQWRAGELRFWKDLVFASDRVAAYRKTATSDRTEFFRKTAENTFQGALAFLLDDSNNVGLASSIMIINSETINQFKREKHHDLDHFETRERFMDASKIMIMLVVDASWETITFYVRGITGGNVFNKSQIEQAGKKSSDVKEILEAFRAANPAGRL